MHGRCRQLLWSPWMACASSAGCLNLLALSRRGINYFVKKPVWSKAPESEKHPGMIQLLHVRGKGYRCAADAEGWVPLSMGALYPTATQPLAHTCCSSGSYMLPDNGIIRGVSLSRAWVA